MVRQAQQVQRAARTGQAGLEQLALDVRHAQLAQLVPVGDVARARHDLQVGKVLACQLHDFERLLWRVHRHHQHARLGRACGAQQVQACGVAVMHAVAKGARYFQHLYAVVEHRGGYALGQQHARHDLPVAPEPGNQDGRLLRFAQLGSGGRARGRRCVCEVAQHQPIKQHQQQRRQQHGQGHRSGELRGHGRCQHLGAAGGLEHDEGKFAPLRQQQREHRALLRRHANAARQGINHQRLDADEAQHQHGHGQWRAGQCGEVDGHAHGHEEQPQQQVFEGLDVGFQLAPVFAVGQQHAGQKGTQRHRQPHAHHQQGNAHHQQQRGGGENFRGATLGNPAQQRAQQHMAAQHHGAHHAQGFEGLHQSVAGVGWVVLQHCTAQQGQQCQDGQGGNVLEQQHRKRGLAAVAAQQLALGQYLQGNGRGRQRQPQGPHQGHTPGQAREPAHGVQRQGAGQHLRRAQAQNGPAQAPQALGLQLQANQKQHQHHAKLGKFQRGLHIFHQPQPPGANGNARRQVANDGAQPQRPRQRHQEHCSRQVHKTGGQPSGCVGHGEMPKILPSGRGG